MFSEVMVGVNTRSGGHDAVALARELLDDGGRLTLVHVDDAGAPIFERNLRFGYDAAGHEATTRLLDQERRSAGADRLLRVSAASIGEGLHRLTEAHGADLLVLGSSRRGRLGRAMVGDDTRESLNGASCAVAIAPVGYAELKRDLSVIGVAYDGSGESIAALAAAREIAAASGAALQACEVVSLPAYVYSSAFAIGWVENVETVVAAAQERLDALDGVEGRAVHGLAGEELAAFGRDVDLLIVGSRGYGPARRLIHGSTSNYLLGHARCALLVLTRDAVAGAPDGSPEKRGAESRVPVVAAAQ
jgi:nucleotide-binding universal stress UspA family protein